MAATVLGGITPASQRNSICTLILAGDANGPKRVFQFPVNPEDVKISRPSRQTVTQTLTGAYQDHLGEGLITLTVSGHTGWHQLVPGQGDGFSSYKLLRDILHEYDRRVAKGIPSTVDLRLLLNATNENGNGWEHFRVAKDTANYMRSKSSPLLYRFDLSFVVLSDEGTHPEVVDPSPAFTITTASTPPPALKIHIAPAVDDSSKHQSTITATPPRLLRFSANANCDVYSYDTTTWPNGETISQLADYYFSVKGFACDRGVCPRDMWPLIVKANPDEWTNASPDTQLNFAGAATEYLNMPRLAPEKGSPFDYMDGQDSTGTSSTKVRHSDDAGQTSYTTYPSNDPIGTGVANLVGGFIGSLGAFENNDWSGVGKLLKSPGGSGSFSGPSFDFWPFD